jgi:hypothetical protein
LDTSIDDGGYAERPFPLSLGNINPTDRANTVKFEAAELVAKGVFF